jgi:hypothetical protein
VLLADDWRRLNRPPPVLPPIVGLLKQAQEFQRRLDSGEVRTQAEIASQEGLTRARVTQLLNLLKLPPDVQRAILSLPVGTPARVVTERKLRRITSLPPAQQRAAAQWLVVAAAAAPSPATGR